MISNFTEDYLKDYEEQIRKLPLDELYEVLDIIRKDDSPERQNIVKARIKEIEGEEDEIDEIDETNTKHNFAQFETFPKQPIESNPDLNDFQITTQDPEQAPPPKAKTHQITKLHKKK